MDQPNSRPHGPGSAGTRQELKSLTDVSLSAEATPSGCDQPDPEKASESWCQLADLARQGPAPKLRCERHGHPRLVRVQPAGDVRLDEPPGGHGAEVRKPLPRAGLFALFPLVVPEGQPAITERAGRLTGWPTSVFAGGAIQAGFGLMAARLSGLTWLVVLLALIRRTDSVAQGTDDP